jgi:hypothetical protein
MRLTPCLAPSALALLLIGCSSVFSTTPGLELTVTPGQIAGDGASPVTVRAKLTKGGAPADGTVHITVSAGTIKETAGVGDPQAYDATTSDGVVEATIIPPRKGRGTIDVKVTSSLEGTALSQASSVNLVPAGGLASSLDFTCAKQNIGAFVSGRTDPIHVLCTAVAKDASGKAITNASIETMAEAGHLDWVTDDQDGTQRLIYTVNPGDPPPRDVDPFDATGKPASSCPAACQNDPNASGCVEPCWIEGGVTHNPRDGLATLVVAVPGVKAFDDRGEPFVDTDDDGARSVGEAYIDYNGNGKYDPPSGALTERMIWRAVRIVWSGDVDTSATTHGSRLVTTTIAGTSGSVTLRINDKNFNTVAAAGVAGADTIQLTSNSCTDGHTLTIPDSLKLEQVKPGIKLLLDQGQPDQMAGIDGPGFSSTYRQGSDYSFNATVDATPTQCDLKGTLNRTYDPGAPGFDPAGDLGTEEISGALSFN